MAKRTSMRLSAASLADLRPTVAVPSYDRAAVTPGILHVGVGNFHRAHQAVYANDLLNAGHDPDWGIRGAGVRPADAAMRDRLAAQDWLSSVVEIDAGGLSASVIGAMVDFLPVAAGHRPIIAAIADPATRIVSLTVTEGGYYVDSATGVFDVAHPDIAQDALTPDSPLTVFGAIVAGLARRRAAKAPITVMSCDNLPGNGDVTRNAVLGLARATDADLAAWIADNVTFPNGMVDRITPATSESQIRMLRDEFGIEDAAPVFCEPFRQWVLEDAFAAGRPDWDAAGVTLTSNVHDYEAMKIRVLNGGHAIIAYAGGLAGIEFVHDAMQHPVIEAFLRKTEARDVLPDVKPVGDLSPAGYLDLTVERFRNPGVADTITRLCFDGSNRQPKFILPSVRDALARGHDPQGLALVSALWCRYCLGRTDAGAPIGPNDPNWDALKAAARRAESDPLAWLDQAEIYGDLRHSRRFCDGFAAAHRGIAESGAIGALEHYLQD